MRALTWQGKHDVRVETVPDPGIVNPRDAIVRITSTAICGSDLHLYDHYIPRMKSGDILGHEFMGEVVEVGSRQRAAEGGSARRGAIRDRVRRLFLLSEATVRRLRQFESRRQGGCFRDRLRLSDDRRLRLFAHDGRLRRRPGRVRSRALRRYRSDRNSGRHRRRQGAVPFRHPADRMDGGGKLHDRARRHRGGLGLRPGRTVRDSKRLFARRRAGHRHRSLSAPPGAGQIARRRSHQLRRGQSSRGAGGNDRRYRSRRLHRRRRHGEPRHGDRQRGRSGEGFGRPRHGSSACAAAGDHGLSQRRARIDSRRVRRHGGQVSDRRPDGERPDHQDRPDARTALHANSFCR